MADITVTLISNLTLHSLSAFLMGPNTGQPHGEVHGCTGNDPTTSSAWCRISWTVLDHMGMLQYYNTPCKHDDSFSWWQYQNFGRFQNSNVCWMIVSKSLNAEVLKVCTYNLDHTGAVLPTAAQGVDQSDSVNRMPAWIPIGIIFNCFYSSTQNSLWISTTSQPTCIPHRSLLCHKERGFNNILHITDI